MTQLMLACFSCRMTGVVSVFRVFCIISSPKNWRSHSICSRFTRCIWCHVRRRSSTRWANASTRKPRMVYWRRTAVKLAGTDWSTHRVRIFSGDPLQSNSMQGLPKARTTTDIRCRLELNGNWRTIPIEYGNCRIQPFHSIRISKKYSVVSTQF